MTTTTIEGETRDVPAAVKRFVENFYRTFDANIVGLANLYKENALLILDDRREIEGKEGILAELTSLPFRQCEHHIASMSCPLGGSMVCVHGDIRSDGKQDVIPFTQSFYLIPSPQGSFYVAVDMFLMNDHRVLDDGPPFANQRRFLGYAPPLFTLAREF